MFEAARQAERRIVFAEGEDERVLRAANAMLEEMTDLPILIGRPEVIERRCERAGLPIRPGRDFQIVNPENDPRYRDYWETYHNLMARRGVTPDIARAVMRTNTTAIGAVMVHRGEADSLICGTFGQYLWHLKTVREVLARDGLHACGALSLMILEDGPLFITDTHVHAEPTPEQIALSVIGAARHARRFGIEPKVALCSHSQFGDLEFVLGPPDARGDGASRPARPGLRLRGRDAYRRSARPRHPRTAVSGQSGWKGRRISWSLRIPTPHRACATS